MDLKFRTKLWEWQGENAWCFVSLPKEYYGDIKYISSAPRRGFGSVRVEVTIGQTTWRTSIFPDSKLGTYLLPVKKSIRNLENLNIGMPVDVFLILIDF